MDKRRNRKIIENKGGIVAVNVAERYLKVASSFDNMERNLHEVKCLMDKCEWI